MDFNLFLFIYRYQLFVPIGIYLNRCMYILDLNEKVFCLTKLFWPFTVQIHCSNDLKSFSQSRNRTIFFSQQVRTFCEIKYQFLKSTNLSHCAVFCCADADTVDVPREHELFDFVIWWLWCWTRECDTWRDSTTQRCVLTKILSCEKSN